MLQLQIITNDLHFPTAKIFHFNPLAWLVVKCFNYIYSFSETCVEKILEFLKNEIDFVLSNIKLGSKKLSCFHELRMEVDMQLQYLKYDL